MMTANELPTLNRCVDELMSRLIIVQIELRSSKAVGQPHHILKRLRDEVDSLERRLARAERLQEEALRGN